MSTESNLIHVHECDCGVDFRCDDFACELYKDRFYTNTNIQIAITNVACEDCCFAEKHRITLTAEAIAYLQEKLVERKTPESRIRLGVRGGKCSGYSYAIEFEDASVILSKDIIYYFDGLEIVVDKKSIIYLSRTILDYEKTLMRRGLKFINPNVDKNCSCGESFSIK